MALKGIKVLEIAGLAPGPFCGMVLSDFGATVIRLDKITTHSIDCLGDGKKSIALNLKDPEAIKIVKIINRSCDVIIEPFRAGIMERLGLGPDILMKDNPRLIYARLSGYGQSGSYSKRAGHDINYLALSGLLSFFGRFGENPSFPVNLVADFGGGGLMCALGIVIALFERSRSNLGQIVDNSMVHGAAYLGTFLYKSQKLPIWGNQRGKNILDGGAAFYEVYKTKDKKFVAVGALEPQFYSQLLTGLGLTIEEAPQFGDFNDMHKLFKTKFQEKTREDWCKIFDSKDACVTPVLDLHEAPKHFHNVHQQIFTNYGGDYTPSPAPKLSRTPGLSSSIKSAPKVGQHTKEILETHGFSCQDILQLEENGVIMCYKPSKL
ncbi:alpha-methylacyl-CoA racemase [Cylas formicarius]|uniref:alpha-methylacyl-CoA racemase n=1 Tax=Cylas formicarius TaxID=197179 RepID=UPI0029589C78|nr:alpha-methylacyl-CoA racemase [Cylas formicarius]XP_060516639.1 alpha-methylacyl-CoA racemase [Cylas formicarius]